MPVFDWLEGKVATAVCAGLAALCLVLGIGLAIDATKLHVRTAELTAEQAAHKADIAKWSEATATAQLQDQQHADAVKASADKITAENDHAISDNLAANRSAVDNFVRKQAAGNNGAGRAPGLPAAPDPAGQSARADQEAVVSRADLDACADAVTIAQGWQDWYRDQLANPALSLSVPQSAPIGAAIADVPPLSPRAGPGRIERTFAVEQLQVPAQHADQVRGPIVVGMEILPLQQQEIEPVQVGQTFFQLNTPQYDPVLVADNSPDPKAEREKQANGE